MYPQRHFCCLHYEHTQDYTLIQMYHSFVFPYLIYCIEIWGNASAIHLEPLIKIQKKSIRAITFSEFSAPSEPLFPKN